MDKHTMKDCRYWILVVSMSPIAILLLIFMALGSLLQFLLKALLLFIIVAITTPFAIMINVSIMMFDYHFRKLSARLRKLDVSFQKSNNDPHWNWSDPRASVGIEIQILVSDFLKTVASELLVVVSAGIITFYTAPLQVFYISMSISLVAILHKWLNTDCLSKTALSCLCDGYGLNPMMFLYSFIGLFNIGGHPVAKCSFAARRAFLFVKDGSNVQFIEEDGHNQIPDENVTNLGNKVAVRITKNDDKGNITSEYIKGRWIPTTAPSEEFYRNRDKPSVVPEVTSSLRKETGTSTPHGTGTGTEWSAANGPPGSPPNYEPGCLSRYDKPPPPTCAPFNPPNYEPECLSRYDKPPPPTCAPFKEYDPPPTCAPFKEYDPPPTCAPFKEYDPNRGKRRDMPMMIPYQATGSNHSSISQKAGHYRFNGAESPTTTTTTEVTLSIDFDRWNAFERGLFQLSPRIDFIIRKNGKYILKSFMVLKLCKALQCKGFLSQCEYPVERLELSEDYSKANELYHFLVTLSKNDGFVTDKMRGRYEQSSTLSAIVDEVEKNVGYEIVKPVDKKFVVA